MKKFYAVGFSCLFILTSFYAYSQDMAMSNDASAKNEHRSVAFGLRAGVNFASVVSKNDNTPKGADIFIRPMGGFYVSIPAGKGFAVQPEVLYNGMGWKEKTFPDNKFIKFAFDCISVPLFAKYSFEHTGLAVYLGPQFDFLIAAKAKGDSTVSIKNNYKTNGFTATGGLEFNFSRSFNIGARYQLGISNLIKNPDVREYLKLHAFTFCVGYSF